MKIYVRDNQIHSSWKMLWIWYPNPQSASICNGKLTKKSVRLFCKFKLWTPVGLVQLFHGELQQQRLFHIDLALVKDTKRLCTTQRAFELNSVHPSLSGVDIFRSSFSLTFRFVEILAGKQPYTACTCWRLKKIQRNHELNFTILGLIWS